MKKEDGSFNNTTCHHCNGSGYVSNSPYGVYTIKPPSKEKLQTEIPNPAIQYVSKNTDIPRFQDEHVKGHIYKALSSVNMEFLAESPINQSGVAKEFDENELNNFVSSVAEDIVFVLDRCYYFINEYRYNIIVPSKEARLKMLPTIPVPEKYGLISPALLMQEIQTSKTSKVNPILTKNLEIDYARKKFNFNTDIAKELETVFNLDPFYGYEQADKMTMVSNGGITERDYIISCNIVQFVQRAAKENDSFFEKSFADKQKIIQTYAQEIVTANSEKQQILSGIDFKEEEIIEE
jgi:hypothetical protein